MLLAPQPCRAPSITSTPDIGIPGVLGAECHENGLTWDSTLNATLYNPAGKSGGPYPFTSPVDAAAHGVCARDAVLGNLRNGTVHAWDSGDEAQVTAFSFCHEGVGAVFYSTIPIDYYLVYHAPEPSGQLHGNALSVFTNMACPGARRPAAV